MMKKLMSLLLSSALLLTLLPACGSTGTTPPDTSEPTEQEEGVTKTTRQYPDREEITMWFWGPAPDYQEHIKDVLCGWYNESQDQYELTIEFRNTVDVDMPRALAAHNAPDIVYASGPSYTAVYANEGLVLDLNDYAEQYGWKDRVLGVMYDACTLDGHLYSVPGGMVIGGILYNKATFEEKGWEPPTTIDEMVAIMDEAKAEGMYPLAAGNKGWKPCNDHFSSMIINHLGSPRLFYDALTGNTSFNNPEMVQAVQTSADWFQAGYLAGNDYVNLDSQEAIQTLKDGRSAMAMVPTLYIQFAAQSFDASEADQVGFVPMPTVGMDEDVYDVSMNCNFAINADTKHADECAKILDYMLTAEFGGKMTEGWPGYWAIPVKDMANYDASSMTGLSKLTMDILQQAIDSIDAGYFCLHPSSFFPSATVTAFEDIDTVWQGVMTAEQFCQTVDAELQNDISNGLVCPLTEPAY